MGAFAAEPPAAAIPTIDATIFLEGRGDPEACRAVAHALETCGCLVIRDPRVSSAQNDTFLDLMERYFAQSDGVTDARPELYYQVGVTPAGVERPRDHGASYESLADTPKSRCPPVADPKWRFFWRIGERPEETEFADLNAPPVVPAGFEAEWAATMDAWGEKLVAAAETVARMAALGFGLPEATFADYLSKGPHLLAPTGSDLRGLLVNREEEEDGAVAVSEGTVLAGFHTDLNFLTVHGKSRFPGLAVWRRDGKAVAPSIPEGHLLVQAGKQLEYLTGGRVLAGFHEVVASEATSRVALERHASGASLWRVSSTCFAHVASDKLLTPLLGESSSEASSSSSSSKEDGAPRFPPIKAGDQVKQELDAINLKSS